MDKRETITIERGAISLAGLAFMETPGSGATKVRAAVWAYLWACGNVRPMIEGTDLMVYPSLAQLREALATEYESAENDRPEGY